MQLVGADLRAGQRGLRAGLQQRQQGFDIIGGGQIVVGPPHQEFAVEICEGEAEIIKQRHSLRAANDAETAVGIGKALGDGMGRIG